MRFSVLRRLIYVEDVLEYILALVGTVCECIVPPLDPSIFESDCNEMIFERAGPSCYSAAGPPRLVSQECGGIMLA